MIERKRGNFVLFKADFADVCGQYVEKSNAEQDKIYRLQPIDGNFNRLLAGFVPDAIPGGYPPRPC